MEFFVRACIPGASSPPFLRCAHMVALKGRKREGEKSKRRKKRTGRRSAVGREKERKNERGREKREDVSAGILAPCHLWERDTSFSLDALLRFRIVTQPRRPSFAFYTSLLLLFPVPCLLRLLSAKRIDVDAKTFCVDVPSRLPPHVSQRDIKNSCLRRWRLTLPNTSFSTRNNHVWIFQTGFDFNSIMMIIVCLVT